MTSDGRKMVWVGPSHSRAERLPENLWETYKQELRRLYEIMTLDDLMSFMSRRYNFRPTRRQYVYHLHKWGSRKYGCEAQAEPSAQMTSCSVTFCRKRDPSASISTKGSNPDAHAPKRQMFQTPIEFKDPLHGLGLSFDTLNADEHHLLFHYSNDYRAPALDDFEQWTKGQRLIYGSNVKSLRIDISQNIDAFSNEDFYEMKRAADFLAAMYYHRHAFPLYVLILKRLRATPTCPDWMITWIVIAYSRTAISKSQQEIVRSLLEQRLDECPGSAPLIYQFVARMLLVDVYAQRNDYEMEIYHTEAATHSEHSNETLLSCLPDGHRSFDLWTYHFLVRRCSHRMKKDCPRFHCSRLDMPVCGEARADATQRLIMYRRPGPFEIENGVMANPCLRSCLTWVARAIGEIQTNDVLLSALDSAQRTGSKWYITLFCELWECWQLREPSPENQLLWATKAEKLMGISATMLLRVVARMIYIQALTQIRLTNDVTNNGNIPEVRLANRAKVAASGFLQETDSTLATKFLRAFSSSQVFSLRSRNEQRHFREFIRRLARDKLEQGLQLILLEVIFNLPGAGAESQDHGTSKAHIPSFASISTESDLLSFRSLRNRIRNGVRTAAQVANTTPPSSIFRRGTTDAATMLSMNDLSLAFESVSLYSSGARSRPTSTL
ncbi:MAG: hypothetical protein M1820_003610 [Bogoriella megaspora]|nr:MAG: hypothetical protein M1820_003610 [Bogoriella megaspora]